MLNLKRVIIRLIIIYIKRRFSSLPKKSIRSIYNIIGKLLSNTISITFIIILPRILKDKPKEKRRKSS